MYQIYSLAWDYGVVVGVTFGPRFQRSRKIGGSELLRALLQSMGYECVKVRRASVRS